MPNWLLENKKLSVKGLYTPYGKLDLSIKNKNLTYNVNIKTQKETTKNIILHLPKSETETDEIKIIPFGLKAINMDIEL